MESTVNTLLVAFCLVQITRGHSLSRFWRNEYSWQTEINEDTPNTLTTESCAAFAARGRCEFFTCLQRQLSCSATRNLIRSAANRFCHHSHRLVDTFNNQGQTWIQQTNSCTMQRLSIDESLQKHRCEAAQQSAEKAFIHCAARANICDVIWSNRQQLMDLFTPRHWLTLVEMAQDCPRHIVTKFIFWSLDQLGN